MSYNDKQEALEKDVLSIALGDIEKLKDSRLTPDLFEIPIHRDIVFQCKKEISKGITDLANICLNAMYSFQESARNYFAELIGDLPFISDYDSFLAQLEDRRAIRTIEELCETAKTDSLTIDELKTKIASLNGSMKETPFKKWSFDELHEKPRTGDEAIDFKRDFYMQYVRLKKHTVNVIGARTGVGKTTYALNLANDLAERYRVLYFNLEMDQLEVNRRLLALESGIDVESIEKDCLTDIENTHYTDACWRYSETLNIAIIDGSKSIDSIRKIIASESREEHCIVFVDHIGYINNKGFTNTRESVQHTMIELNNISKDFDCTIFAISQLNRGAEGEMPQLKDLKDSGEVEQTAHSITLLYDKSNDRALPIAEYQIICAKNRGKTGIFGVRFNRRNQRFIYPKEQRTTNEQR